MMTILDYPVNILYLLYIVPVIVVLIACAVRGDVVFQSHLDHPDCPQIDPKGHTVMLPYPGDCTKFYMCDHGKAIPWLCPAGTHFNTKTSQCDWPHVAGCIQPPTQKPPVTPPPVKPEITQCPKEDPKDRTIMLPYPGDCTMFYMCNHGVAIPWNCPGGTHFNSKTSLCDWPHVAGCQQPATPSPPPDTKPPPLPSGKCPAVDPKDRTIMLPYPGDCTKFFMCNHGKAIPWSCPAGTHFNPKTSLCDWPHAAGCTGSPSNPQEPATPAPPVRPGEGMCPKEDPKDRTIMLPFPGDCTKFYMCNHGKAIPWLCPAGTHFNSKTSLCDWPHIAGCMQKPCPKPTAVPPPVKPEITQCPKEDPKDRTIMLPYPGDCTMFYMCNHGVAIPWNCPGGTHFNSKTSLCDWPHVAGCQQPAKPSPPPDTKPPPLPSGKCPAVDPKDRTIMLPYPGDCTKFFMCNHGKAIPWSCPAGTHFNPKTSLCDWPHAAGCTGSPSNPQEPATPAPPVRPGEGMCPKEDPKDRTIMLPFPGDCTKFYMCNHGKAIPWLCPAGTHFNSKTSLCDWPHVAGCMQKPRPKPSVTPPPVKPEITQCPKEDPKDRTIMLPYPGDCTKFYMCNHGQAIMWNCPGGTHFNKKTSMCDWPSAAGCVQPPRPTQPSVTLPPPVAGNCPNVDPKDRTIMLPFPGDCTKFYMCNHGKAIPWSCPAGTHFNSKTSLCDWPHAAGCTDITTNLQQPTTERQPLYPAGNHCPKVDPKDRTVMLPYPGDCTKFYMCNHGKAIPWLCPVGTHFNVKTSLCDWPHAAGCSQRPTVQPPPPSPTSSGNPGQCPKVDPKDRTIMLPFPGDCTKFYMCNHGRAIPWNCPGGTYFNAKLSVCDWPNQSGCVQPTRPPTPPTVRPPVPGQCPSVDPKNYTVMFPYPGDCTKFYMCNHGSAIPWSCPAGTYFNAKLSICDWPSKSGCVQPPVVPTTPAPPTVIQPPVPVPSTCPKVDPKDHTVMFPYPGDCNKYFVCNHGKAIPWSCPGGTHFSAKLSVCVWPAQSGCVQEPPPPPQPKPDEAVSSQCPSTDFKDKTIMLPNPRDCTKYYVCNHGKAIPWDCPAGTHFNRVSSVCDWPASAGCAAAKPPQGQSPWRCPSSPPPDQPTRYLYAYPGNCKLFFMCVNGMAHVKVCPSNMHFNDHLMVCDWIHNAGCQH
ncbi:hypothetical protein AAG570_006934 [Ranatra chinensis]|uniref:Chitin-binding type-2 domain-containing protein n=1 Tax=Ranatra chinensis TaxID=642074 RepID=A0ABD0Z852_9HEMI